MQPFYTVRLLRLVKSLPGDTGQHPGWPEQPHAHLASSDSGSGIDFEGPCRAGLQEAAFPKHSEFLCGLDPHFDLPHKLLMHFIYKIHRHWCHRLLFSSWHKTMPCRQYASNPFLFLIICCLVYNLINFGFLIQFYYYFMCLVLHSVNQCKVRSTKKRDGQIDG